MSKNRDMEKEFSEKLGRATEFCFGAFRFRLIIYAFEFESKHKGNLKPKHFGREGDSFWKFQVRDAGA